MTQDKVSKKLSNDRNLVKWAAVSSVLYRSVMEGRTCRERQRFRWRDGIERNMRYLGREEEDTQDRSYWRQHTRAADPTRD